MQVVLVENSKSQPQAVICDDYASAVGFIRETRKNIKATIVFASGSGFATLNT